LYKVWIRFGENLFKWLFFLRNIWTSQNIWNIIENIIMWNETDVILICSSNQLEYFYKLIFFADNIGFALKWWYWKTRISGKWIPCFNVIFYRIRFVNISLATIEELKYDAANWPNIDGLVIKIFAKNNLWRSIHSWLDDSWQKPLLFRSAFNLLL
jgi:hypothetical protein